MGLQDMTGKEIRGTLDQLTPKVTLAALAREAEKSPTAYYKVADGKIVSHEIRKHIAEAMGLPLEEVWPETYVVHGGKTFPGRPATQGIYPNKAA